MFLNDFDHWMKQDMGFSHYGRYVDDFFVIHPDKPYLLKVLPKITDYLKMNEKLTLHPNKTLSYLHCQSRQRQLLPGAGKAEQGYSCSQTKQ